MCLTEDPSNLTLNHKHLCSWSAEIKGKIGGEGVSPPKMQSELSCPHCGSESLTQSDAGGKGPLGLSATSISSLLGSRKVGRLGSSLRFPVNIHAYSSCEDTEGFLMVVHCAVILLVF